VTLHASEPMEPVRSPSRFRGSRRPVLVLAESDETCAEPFAAGLTETGIDVVLCRDGAEALLRAGVDAAATVLLGAPLPVIDAVRVTRC
jgi:DNA-binding response OmpR family regulator